MNIMLIMWRAIEAFDRWSCCHRKRW